MCVFVCVCACESILFTSARRWITHSHLSNLFLCNQRWQPCFTEWLAKWGALQSQMFLYTKKKKNAQLWNGPPDWSTKSSIFESSLGTINLFDFYILLKTLEIKIKLSEALNKGHFRQKRTIWLFNPFENIGCWKSSQYCKLKCLSFLYSLLKEVHSNIMRNRLLDG